MHRVTVYLLFFLSGISGLVYQVVWVRELGNVFGVTVYSASLVTAVFMTGLGGGSYAAGIWADRRPSTARLVATYGGAEIAIGLLGLAIAFLVPNLGTISAAISSYAVDERGWHTISLGSSLLRYVAASVLLLPSTFLMGATLPLLVRFVVADELSEVGWRVGWLYGLNTAGAALGAFSVDFAFIPTIGLFRTQLVAATLNVGVGVGAFVLARRASDDEDTAIEQARVGGRPRALVLTAAGVFCFGVAAMGAEILWFRFLSGAMGQFRSVFSVVLTVILVGLWLGSVLGGYINRKLGHPDRALMVLQGAFVVATMALLVTFDPTWANRFFVEALEATAGTGSLPTLPQYLGVLRSTAALVGVPSLVMGATYPLANAHVQRRMGHVGRRAGLLYLATTGGNVMGVLGTGFLLLPQLGSQHTTLVLGSFCAVGVVCIFLSTRREPRTQRGSERAFAWGLGLAALAIATWVGGVPNRYLLRRNLQSLEKGSRYLTAHEGITEVLAISEDEQGYRTLWTNGHAMSGTLLPSQRYMRAFSHIPLLQLDEPERALVICFGVGTTAHATSLHPTLSRIEIADMSASVLEHAHYFEATNESVLEDPRVKVFVNDGRQHLRMQPPEIYDLVTLEPPPISFAGVAALYSREFYALAKSRLVSGGFLTQWLPIHQVDGPTALSMVRAFLDVFPSAVLLSGHQQQLILIGQRDGPNQIELETVARNLAAREAVHRDLAHVAMGRLTEIVGTFVSDAEVLREATEGVAPVTDDRPSMEYTIVSHAMRNLIPAGLFAVDGVRNWCPSCFVDGEPKEPVADLERYLAVLGTFYASREFLFFSTIDDDRPEDAPVFDPSLHATIRSDPYLRSMLGGRLTD
jgi:predicted membrane-bound spermidine synthase